MILYNHYMSKSKLTVPALVVAQSLDQHPPSRSLFPLLVDLIKCDLILVIQARVAALRRLGMGPERLVLQ